MVRKYIDEISYDVIQSNFSIKSMDYNIEQNEIFVEDNLLGIMEIERKLPYIDIVKRLDWSRP